MRYLKVLFSALIVVFATASGVGFISAPRVLAAGDLARVAGSNRTATAISICQRLHPNADSAGAVLLTRADQFPDALASASLAGLLNACVLLVPVGTTLDASVHAEVDRALPGGAPVLIIGGTAAVPASIDSALQGGYKVERIAGADRYSTAKLLKERGDSVRGTAATAVILASGQTFPDALSVSSYAAFAGVPILLTKTTTLPVYTANALSSVIRSIFVIGGIAAISDAVVTQVEGATGNIAQRIAGSDRYATSTAAANFFFATPFAVTIATGSNFPDALAGGVLAGKTPLSPAGTPLVLTKSSSVPGSVATYLVQHAGTIDDTTSGYVLGGTSAVSNATVDALNKLL